MISVNVEGHGGRLQEVTPEGAAIVSLDGYPPRGTHPTRPFASYLRNSAGSESLVIDGSVTPVPYYISSSDYNDRYITGLSVIIGYGSAAYLFEFADELALTNGITLKYQSAFGEFDICDSLKKNSDLLRIGINGIRSTWEARNFAAVNDYGYEIFVDLIRFLPPNGVKLDAGSTQKITATVRDNLTLSVDLLNIYAIGFERF